MIREVMKRLREILKNSEEVEERLREGDSEEAKENVQKRLRRGSEEAKEMFRGGYEKARRDFEKLRRG